MIYKPWIPVIPSKKQRRYQPVTNFTSCPVLGSFNNWNIIQLSHKSIPFEVFEEIYQVFIDGISDNMASLVKSGKYGAINIDDTQTIGYYFIKFISEAYTLKNNTTIDRQIVTFGELVIKAQYLCYIQDRNNWYWGQYPQQQAIIFPTFTIIYSRLDVFGITYVQDIPILVCTRVPTNPHIQRHTICL